ncbi:putative extracellular glycosyl hydrolase/cellulase [Aspergillus clavatus NRRL 1]|uniref:Alpha-L-arabinofuranosidase n=1 Tax=Aspergillus clavatus (strain ATCC 1007 / CBS 513.65 / DSM 816 / NCTC 3887 / NRRL 1 / QM 1276 / 107) TaxID=344612 RepID=A1CCD2_ASPCL|nr:glycosyl hydrolase family 62 protein [Aspergillus clavatus NRRL 1]EAW12189.1 glycosyl hydrolase family 62 protein [Aspergillus clavatus NRRL 1]
MILSAKMLGAILLELALTAAAQQTLYGQCGGNGWTGPTQCVSGACCQIQNPWYSQCLPGSCSPSTTLTRVTTTATSTASTATSGTGGSLPSSFKWSSSGPLVDPKNDGRGIAALKDPSIVEVDGTYHVFASTATSAGYNMVYFNFTDFNQANNAPFFYLDKSPIGSGYRAAPQVFFFKPQNLWYLVYQNGNAAYSTNKDISNPAGWSAPKTFYSSQPSIITENIGNGYWVDMWVICDSANCHLFSSDDNGHLYRSQTTLANFPNGMTNTVIAMQDSNPNNLFEASNVYHVGGGKYLLIVEAIGSGGDRYFRSWTSTSLTGTWTALAASESNPFAGAKNVAFSGNVWTKSISHGEMIRDQVDQTLTISPCKLRYLYQGVDPAATGNYNSLPWKLALLTQTNSAC